MKNILMAIALTFICCACGTSQHVGQWQGQMNGKPCILMLNSDGSVLTEWTNKNGEQLTRSGTWEQATDDSILLKNKGSESTLIKLVENQLVINRNRRRLIFHRKINQ